MEKKYLKEQFNISEENFMLSIKAEEQCQEAFKKVDEIARVNTYKVIKAFQDHCVSETHFMASTGYGYGDRGREVLDEVYAQIFNTEDALVRMSIASGTVALSIAMFANLRPQEEILFVSGKPYDTLLEATGLSGNAAGSMKDYGIVSKVVDLLENGSIDYEGIKNSITSKTKMVFVQKSRGYEWRNPIMNEEIEKISIFVKNINDKIIIMVDNCYGEFVQTSEPTEHGADLIAGSLIKNIGGGIAPSGGYIAGKKELIENCASRIYSPGLSKEVGSSIVDKRLLYQGLYLAPNTVAQALKGAIFASALFNLKGYKTSPRFDDVRGDIIQLIEFNTKEELIKFCQNVQKSSPVDSHVVPYPWDMPGYENEVIMAAGTFVQGASIEFSADAPMKEPYIAYMQGGLVYSQVKLGMLLALQNM